MCKIKWELIFINNGEFKIYLSTSDFKELSMLSKLTRLKLKSYLFEYINICHGIINGLIKLNIESASKDAYSNQDYSESTIDDHIILFSRYFQKFVTYAKSINIQLNIGHYQLIQVFISTPNLTNLTIIDTKMSLATFKNVLSKFKNLEYLDLKFIKFIQYKNEIDQIATLKLPNNLKYINWQYNTIFDCELEKDPQSLEYNYIGILYSPAEFLFELNHFSNLKKFTSSHLPINFFQHFLSINTELTWLNITIYEFKDFYIIANLIQSIKILELKVEEFSFYNNSISLYLPKLISLYIYDVNFQIWPIIEKLILSNPNIVELNITVDNEAISSLLTLANSLNLRKLTIIGRSYDNFIFNNFKPLTSLIYLELAISLDIYSVLNNVYSCTYLKTVRFWKEYLHKDCLLSLNQENSPERWRFTNIGKFLNYYKI